MQKAYCVIHLIEIYSVEQWVRVFIRLLLEKGNHSNEDRDGNENVIKATALLDKKNKFARASYFFVQFFAVPARLRR